MSDKYSNGLQWENLALQLFDLSFPLGEVTPPLSASRRAMLPPEEPTKANRDIWQKIEAGHRESVHKAARTLIRTGRVSDIRPEIVYFLGLRLHAAINHIEELFVMKDDRPVSLLAFPALSSDQVAEWFLTEWADDHAITLVFPEMANA